MAAEGRLIVLAGLPGTGKSTLARGLGDRTGARVLSKDAIREALFAGRIEYSREQDDFCVEVMLQTAAGVRGRDPGAVVILDGRTFSRRYQLARVREFAGAAGVRVDVLLCECPEEVALARLAAQTDHPARDRDAALYWRVRGAWEGIEGGHRVIGTAAAPDECLDEALRALSLS
ncbi:MAG: ATP-binding protein [Acidobacteria bacterium]|nr:ATP-binding protein [Acidobacteriota bacterium]